MLERSDRLNFQTWNCDLAAGPFTQEDPIGLGGGMNGYGFASGDRVNFGDPMGLCSNPTASGLGGLQCVLEDAVAGGRSAASSFAAKANEFWGNHSEQILGAAAMLVTDGLSAAEEVPLLGRNPGISGGVANTDLPGGRAVGKSIFRNLTKGQAVESDIMKDGGLRRFAPDGTQIRMHPDGKTNLDLPRGPTGKEDVHIKPPM